MTEKKLDQIENSAEISSLECTSNASIMNLRNNGNIFKGQIWTEKKLELIENVIYLIAERNYRNGFPYYNENFRKRQKLFNWSVLATIQS